MGIPLDSDMCHQGGIYTRLESNMLQNLLIMLFGQFSAYYARFYAF